MHQAISGGAWAPPDVPREVLVRAADLTLAVAVELEEIVRRDGAAALLAEIEAGRHEPCGSGRAAAVEGLVGCLWAAPDARLVLLSARAPAVTSMSASHLFVSEGAGDLVDEDGPLGVPPRNVLDVIRTGRPLRSSLHYSPGTKRWLLVNLEPIREADDGPVRFVLGGSRGVRSRERRPSGAMRLVHGAGASAILRVEAAERLLDADGRAVVLRVVTRDASGTRDRTIRLPEEDVPRRGEGLPS